MKYVTPLFWLVAGAAILGPRAAPLAAAGDVALDNLDFTIGATVYRIPHLELKGATLSAAELSDLFKGDEKAVDARLARFSAKGLTVPSLTTERRIGDRLERATYRQVTAEDIATGQIATLRAAGMEQTLEKPDGGGERYLWGPSLLKGVHLRQLAHLALATGLAPQEERRPVLDEENVESLVMEDKAGRLSVRAGALTLKDLKGRALPAPPRELLERIARVEPDKPDSDPTLAKELIDAAGSFEVGAMEIKEIVVTGKGAPSDKPFAATLGRIAAARVTGVDFGALTFEDMSLLSSDGGRLSLKRFGLRDAHFSALLDSPYPRIGHIEFKGLEGDLPDARLGETSRMKFSLDGIEADFADFREIAPTKINVRMDRLAVDLAARGEAPSTAQFLALGYRNLDFAAALAGEWREKTQEAVFAPLRIEGKDMGAATLAVTFGNVSGAVFSSMAVVSRAAALAASLKSVELTLEGGGLVDRMVTLDARDEKKPIEKARAEYARAASLAVVALCGGGEKARKIGEAVAAYILKPQRLHLRLSSENGIGTLDALAKKPGDILESVDVEATADK